VVGITPTEEDEDEVLLHLFDWPGDPVLADMSLGAVLDTAEQCEAMHLYRLMMEQRSWSSRMEALQSIIMIRKEIYHKREDDEAVQARMHQAERYWWDIIQGRNMSNRLDQDLGKLESLVSVVEDGETDKEVFRVEYTRIMEHYGKRV
jgi:hypothetical protein